MGNKRIVVVGATSSIAEHCMRLWALDTVTTTFELVGRDKKRLDAVGKDLAIRAPKTIFHTHTVDFKSTSEIKAFVDSLYNEGRVDTVFIAQGVLPSQKKCQENLDLVKEAIDINATSVVLFAEAFASHMETVDHGKLALVGSVAGDRGRQSNYVYGSTKSLVSCYAEGLQHRFAFSNVCISLIKPGPTATPMTSNLDEEINCTPVEEVAQIIVKGIDKKKACIYTPLKWKLIMLVIRNLPTFVFNKLRI